MTVENALYADPRVLEAAAVGVPDERLGELVVAIVSLRPAYIGQVTEEALISQTRTRFVFFINDSSNVLELMVLKLRFAQTSKVCYSCYGCNLGHHLRYAAKLYVTNEALQLRIERTPSGKIIKGDLRRVARSQWELRRRGEKEACREPRVNL